MRFLVSSLHIYIEPLIRMNHNSTIDSPSKPILKPYFPNWKRSKMASSPLRSKSHFHARSISLPSRLHPLAPQVEDHLCKLRASRSSATSLSVVSERLSLLKDTYDCLDDMLLLPKTQQSLDQQSHEKWVEEILDGYLSLLDVCSMAKDVSSQTKQDVQGLLSMLRRRRDETELGGYLASRKKAKKAIQKSLKSLNKSKHTNKLCLNQDNEVLAIATSLKEVEGVTVEVLESLLSNLVGTKEQSRLSGFSLVSKLIHRKNLAAVASKGEETSSNDFEKVDVLLSELSGHKTSRSNVDKLQNQLQKMELSIQDLEEGLESLFRRLIKTRVSLLNILNH